MDRCSVCHEDRDCNEMYKWAGEPAMEEPKYYCNQCMKMIRMEKLLCKDCFNKWKGDK